MPFKSKAQQRWGNSPAGRKALGKAGVAEWNSATKGLKLPDKVPANANHRDSGHPGAHKVGHK